MKKLMLLGILSLSSTAFANYCEVDMVNRYNQIVSTFRNFDCVDAMKECRKTIRFSPQYGGVDCIRRDSGSSPIPNPYPNPIPNPYPTGRDNFRMIHAGESVIYSNQFQTVVGQSLNGTYAVKNSWGSITQNIQRENIAVTNGCGLSSCVGDSVISLRSHSYETIVGLRYDEGYVLKNNWGSLSTVNENDVAITKGCLPTRWTQICVGNQVITSNNSYKTVIGIQNDGRVVLKDSWGSISTNVSPDNLIITQ